MVARSIHPVGEINPDAELSAQDLDPDAADKTYEPVRPAEGPRQQALALVAAPGRLALIGSGVAAALVGGAFGYWLGRRHAPRPARPVRQLASTIDSALDLAPVAMRLLANPLIRALAVRVLLRQLSRRIEH
jgi:hypothetical protein